LTKSKWTPIRVELHQAFDVLLICFERHLMISPNHEKEQRNNTWQTPITEEGLDAIKKLLKKTASKNTAVSCHQLKSRIRTELLWVVGKREKFNSEGIVAVNYTEQDKFIGEFEIENIRLIRALAVL
jgi:hypothetical protein